MSLGIEMDNHLSFNPIQCISSDSFKFQITLIIPCNALHG